jgi:hypothetical protein
LEIPKSDTNSIANQQAECLALILFFFRRFLTSFGNKSSPENVISNDAHRFNVIKRERRVLLDADFLWI